LDTLTDEDASHVFKCLDQVTPFHLRDQQLFNLTDVWHVLRFQIIQQVLQVFGKLFFMLSLSLVVGIFIQETNKKLVILSVCEFDFSHKGTSKNSYFVAPAKAGVQSNQQAGFPPARE